MKEQLFERNKIIEIILISILCCGIIFSCKTQHDNISQKEEFNIPRNTPYITSGGYKNIYLVDTIRIENAVSFTTTGGHRVITSDSVFHQLKSYNDDILKRDNVFLLSCFGIRPIEIWKFSTSWFDNSHLKYEHIENTPENISAIRFHGTYISRLFLMTRKFYNDWFSGMDCCPMIRDGDDHLFIKVLID
ncbi:MAG: hypothetical protein IK017_01130 [Paludibacteraceae bacterium]|nr:hypothetical protein [Paludibacteraceae bacterium]